MPVHPCHPPLRVRRKVPHVGPRHPRISRRGIEGVTQRSLFGERDDFRGGCRRACPRHAIAIAITCDAVFTCSDGAVYAHHASRMAPPTCQPRVVRTRKEVRAKTTMRKASETCANGPGRSPTTPRAWWIGKLQHTCDKRKGSLEARERRRNRLLASGRSTGADAQRRGSCRPASCAVCASPPTQVKRPASAAFKTKIESSPTCMESTIPSCRCAHVQDGRRTTRSPATTWKVVVGSGADRRIRDVERCRVQESVAIGTRPRN